MIALGISGSVLAMTFWPAVREDNRRVALATIVTILLLHVLLSVGCLVCSCRTCLVLYLFVYIGCTSIGTSASHSTRVEARGQLFRSQFFVSIMWVLGNQAHATRLPSVSPFTLRVISPALLVCIMHKWQHLFCKIIKPIRHSGAFKTDPRSQAVVAHAF